MTFQSIKKTLPASCRCMEAPLISKVASTFSSPAPALPRGYLKFARRVARELFPSGISPSLYEDHCSTAVPPLSGCVDGKRSDGGQLGTDFDHDSYLSVVFGGVSFDPDDYCAELTVVQSAGKPRPLSKQPAEALCLQPLHKSLYDSLSRRKWLHRGDVTTDSLRRAGFTSPPPGHVLTSGDYKSATDGLSIEVAESVLGEILDRSVSVPNSIKRFALLSLRPRLFSLEHKLDFRATRGQQMGSYLSFPLLCLQNYIAFRYAAFKFGVNHRTVPLAINGDDILFCSSLSFSRQWMEWMSCLSLEVELTKTSVSSTYGSLNSTLVRVRRDTLCVIPTVRFGMLQVSQVEDFAGVFRDFIAGLSGRTRFRAAHLFFRNNIGLLRATNFTTYELGVRGRLGERMTERFKLKCGGDWCANPLSLPQRFVEHSVTLSSDSVTWVPTAELSKEELSMCARELAAWRFSVPWSRARYGAIHYVVTLSMSRPDAPVFDFGRWSCTTTDWTRVWRRMMRAPLVVVRRTPVCNRLWDWILWNRPPPDYSDFEEGVDLLEVAKDGKKD
jgi:hypothetical protein